MNEYEWERVWNDAIKEEKKNKETGLIDKESVLTKFMCKCGHSFWQHNSVNQICYGDRESGMVRCKCGNVEEEDMFDIVEKMRKKDVAS